MLLGTIIGFVSEKENLQKDCFPRYELDSVEIKIKVLKNYEPSIDPYDGSKELLIEVKYTNNSSRIIKVTKNIYWGLKSRGDSYFKITTIDNIELNFEREIDYHYPLFDDYFMETVLKPGANKTDTIDLNIFNHIDNAGKYLVSFIDKQIGVESNVDTITVR